MDATDPHGATLSTGKGREGEVWIRKFFHLLPDFPVIRNSITKSNCRPGMRKTAATLGCEWESKQATQRPGVGAGAGGPGSAFCTSARGDILFR